MTQSTKPTSQTFRKLLNATRADTIVSALVQCCWNPDKNAGEPPPLTNIDLLNSMPSELDYSANIRGAFDSNFDRWQSEAYSHLFDCFRAIGLEVKATTREQWDIMNEAEWNQAVFFVFEGETLLSNETPDFIKWIKTDEMFLMRHDIDIGEELKETLAKKYTDAQRQSAEFDRLYLDLSSIIHYITQQPETTHISEDIPEDDRQRTQEVLNEVRLQRTNEKIERIHSFWKFCYRRDNSLSHPLAPAVRECLIDQTHRTVNEATADHANDLTTIPYAASEVHRRKWEPDGSVDTIEVDGEPIVTHIKQLPGPFVSDPDDATLFKPQGTQGELMPMPVQRDNMGTPVPLVAYQKYGKNLRSALASDVAQLMNIAYAANEPLILTSQDGASLLARGQDGKLRRTTPADETRFEHAFACIHGMAAWIVDDRNIPRFYPLTACDRFSDGRVRIAPASWARDRTKGKWTLTAGFGIAGQNRLKGNAHNNNIWRVITGVEYWLARERFAAAGTHKGISQALIPASGTTGPGNWYTLSWHEIMMIAGDIWDWNDKQANKRAHKRFQKIKEALIKHGYHVKFLNTPAEAGDTVEILFGKRKDGKLQVRATKRFVEGARKAKKRDWQTVNLSDFLGF